MINWLNRLVLSLHEKNPCVLVTVADVKGSSPRETGTRMLIWEDKIEGTIGGGNLEYEAIAIARENLIKTNGTSQFLKQFPLATRLGQCCGGVVVLIFENFEPDFIPSWLQESLIKLNNKEAFVLASVFGSSEYQAANKLIITNDNSIGILDNEELTDQSIRIARDLINHPEKLNDGLINPLDSNQLLNENDSAVLFFEPIIPNYHNVVLFGAGHVGRALVHILSSLNCQVTWIDERKNEFPETCADNIDMIITDNPFTEINKTLSNSYYLVITHSHALDQDICERILRHNDFSYLGLIGSKTKRRHFEKRLKQKNITNEQLSRMTCPIGAGNFNSKLPTAIAVSITAELLELFEKHDYERFYRTTKVVND